MADADISNGTALKKYLHVEVYEKLYHKIKSERFKEGDQLPGENQLAAEFGVSRMTLRQSLMLLSEDGIIRRVHGKGNFITSLKPRSSIGAEGIANPVHSFVRVPIDDIQIDIRFEAASDYVMQLFGYTQSMVMMASDRWYSSASRLIAFCFSFTDLAKLGEQGIDIKDGQAVKEFMDNTVYSLCPHSTTHITLSTRKEFSLTPEQMAAPSLILLSETLFTPDGKPIAQNKYYLDPAYFDFMLNARRVFGI
jgi:DNA-binding GntR family transcriptional regulator